MAQAQCTARPFCVNFMGRANLTGAWGEALAGEYLRKKRYQILACNYRCRFGEIYIIAANKKYVAFVEVKLRKSANFAEAAAFVDRGKQERLKTTASIWLSGNECQLQPRFDVIEIYAPEGTATLRPVIHHMEDAFQ